MRPHVGVIGAGFSGLRCADILLQHGFQVTILEGRNRIGGRVHQEKLPNGQLIDMGPNWIHGTNDNPIHDIAEETGTETGKWDESSYMFDSSGKLLPREESERYSTLMWDIIQDAFLHSNTSGDETDPSKSLLDFFQSEVVKRVPETEEGYERSRGLILQVAEMWGAFVGSAVKTQSLKFFWLEECIEGGTMSNIQVI